MFEIKKLKSVILFLLCIAVGYALFVGYKAYNEKEQNHSAQLKEISTQITPLEEKVNELYDLKTKTEKDYMDQMRVVATEQILFTELDSQLYKDVFPIMEKAEVQGMVALSKTEMINNFGKVQYSEMKKMLDAGWTICIAWDGTTDLGEYIDSINRSTAGFGFGKADTVYFPAGTYSTKYDETLLEKGITTAVHHGEESLPLLTLNGCEENEVWHVGASPWNYNGVLADILDMVERGGDRCFTVSFNGLDDQYKQVSFQNMLKQINEYITNGTLNVTTFSTALEAHRFVDQLTSALRPKMEADLEAIDTEIAQTKEQIQELYNVWNER